MNLIEKKQNEFDKIFLEKNIELDKLIEEQWEELLLSEDMKDIYNQDIDTTNVIEDKDILLYYAEDDRYILEFNYANEEYSRERIFQIYHKDNSINFEYKDLLFEIYDTEDSLKLPDNKSKIEYTKEKIDFLDWSKKNNKKVIELIKNSLILNDIDSDIEKIKSLEY
jgi:hypothetical protein